VTEAPFADNPDAPPPDTGPLPGTNPDDGGGTPVPQPEPQPAPKPKRPHGSLRVLTRKLGEARRRGLALRFSSSEAATAQFRVLSARGAKLGSKNRLVGAGRSSLRLKLKHRPGKRLTVKMTLIDAAGLKRTYTAHVTLR
jgi:hypothetical protein